MERIDIPSGRMVGDAITPDLFGVNFVTSFDRVDGSFAQRVEMIGAGFLRYPGGTVTELLFDPADPDARSVSFTRADGVTVTREMEPLSDFLDYLHEADQAGVFVIPTLRYLDEAGQGAALSQDDIAGLRHYIATVLNSGVEVKAFELGNEFMYLDGFSIPAYGQIAGQIALIADDEIRSFEASADLGVDYTRPIVALQSTTPSQALDSDGDGVATAHEAVIALFESLPEGAADVITGLIAHRYISGAYEGIDGVDALWTHLDHVAQVDGRDLPVLLTEWNIKSNQKGVPDWDSASEAERNAIDTGLKQAGALAAYFHEIAANDVEYAAIWGLQHQNQMSLADREGTETGLKAGGVMMQLLQDLVIGTHAMEIARPDPRFDIHGFGGSEGQVFIINSRSSAELDLTLDLSAWVGAEAPVAAQRLSAAEGADPRDPDGAVTLRTLDRAEGTGGDGISLHLAPYEVLILQYDVPVEDPMTEGPTVFDMFELGQGDEVILAEFHDSAMDVQAPPTVADLLFEIASPAPESETPPEPVLNTGMSKALAVSPTAAVADLFAALAPSGDVQLAPALTAEDHIRALLDRAAVAETEAGLDHLRHRGGTEADDTILGRGRDDKIFGRMGHDHLEGGRGDDALFGGVGSDQLYGGQGEDLLLGGAQHDLLWGDEGNDLLFGGAGSDHLWGGEGDDFLSGGAGFDRFVGGAGHDIFFFDAEGAAWRETIEDFNSAEDRLAFRLDGLELMEALNLSREESDLILNYGVGSVVLQGQAEAELTADHFLFL